LRICCLPGHEGVGWILFSFATELKNDLPNSLNQFQIGL